MSGGAAVRPCFDLPICYARTISVNDGAAVQRSPSLGNDDLSKICGWFSIDYKNGSSPNQSSDKERENGIDEERKGVDDSAAKQRSADANPSADAFVSMSNGVDADLPNLDTAKTTETSVLFSTKETKPFVPSTAFNAAAMNELKANLEEYNNKRKRLKSWEITFATDAETPLKRAFDPMFGGLGDVCSRGSSLSVSWPQSNFTGVNKRTDNLPLPLSTKEQIADSINSRSTAELDSQEFDFVKIEPKVKGRKKTTPNNCGVNHCQSKKGTSQIHLYSFLLQLLQDGGTHCHDICWTNQQKREFKIIRPANVAKKWGALKSKPNMTYDKLSRALRYYYNKNIIGKVSGHQFVYRFAQNLPH